jgi:hypothetical protein
MVVPILLEMCEKHVPETRQAFGPAPTPKAPETGPGPAPPRKPTPKRQQK